MSGLMKRGPRSLEVVTVSASRVLTNADIGKILQSAIDLTLTIPMGLKPGFNCVISASNGTVTVMADLGVTFNGAVATSTADSFAFVTAARSYPIVPTLAPDSYQSD
jgi:hypothetical protein